MNNKRILSSALLFTLVIIGANILASSTVPMYLAFYSPLEKHRYWALESIAKKDEISPVRRTSCFLLAVSGDGPVAKYALELMNGPPDLLKIDPEVAAIGLILVLKENDLEIDVSRAICYTLTNIVKKNKTKFDTSEIEFRLSELKAMDRSLYYRGEIDFALYNIKDIKDCQDSGTLDKNEIR